MASGSHNRTSCCYTMAPFLFNPHVQYCCLFQSVSPLKVVVSLQICAAHPITFQLSLQLYGIYVLFTKPFE